MKKQLLLTRMLLLFALIVGSTSSVWAADTLVETIDFTSSNSSRPSISSYVTSSTWGNWTIVGAANNSKGWSYLRIGGGKKNSSPSTITRTTSGISQAIDYIEINHEGRSGSSFSITSITAEASNSTDFTNPTATKTVSSPSITSAGTIKIEFDSRVAANSYYKITINWSNSETSSNAGLNTDNVKFYQKAPAYTITAQSNNNSYGTVTLSGSVITANPAEGYRVSTSTPYTVNPANSATVSQDGNAFNVTPSENTTVTINFEAIPTHTVTCSNPTGGTITLKIGDDVIDSGDNVPEGTTVTITLTPGDNYKYETGNLLVAKGDEEVETTQVDATNYTFEMPAGDVEIDATFTETVFYNINIPAMTNGSVSSNPETKAEAGETVTLTIVPAANYTLNTVLVVDADETNIPLTGTGNTRTFTMPAKAVTVTATFHKPKGSIGNPYTVKEMLAAITSATNNVYVIGYMVGTSDGKAKAVSTTSSSVKETNFVLAEAAELEDATAETQDCSDAIVVSFANDLIRTTYNLKNHFDNLGRQVIVGGDISTSFGKMGMTTLRYLDAGDSQIQTGNVSERSAINGYPSNGVVTDNSIYYVNSSSTVTGQNIIKVNNSSKTYTADEISITDGYELKIAADVTAAKITNNRYLAADEDAYTWYEPYEYTLPDDNVAYTFTGASGTTLTFTETGSQTLAANTPYLIVAKNAVNGSVNSSTVVKATPTTNTSGGTQGNWQFVGTYKTMTATEAEAANMWALGAGNKWYYYTGSDTYGVYPRRAYMINSADKANAAKQFDTTFGEAANEATHIELVNKQNPDESRIYTLDGKYVGTKKEVLNGGIYVKDGKKFIIK